MEGQLLLQCQTRRKYIYRFNKSGRLAFGIERFDGCLQPAKKLQHCKPGYVEYFIFGKSLSYIPNCIFY